MGVFELFSRRTRTKERIGFEDVYVYDEISRKLRVQIIHILQGAIGVKNREVWKSIHNTMARELGRYSLSSVSHIVEYVEQCFYFLEHCDDEEAIDFIELCFFVINTTVRDYDIYDIDIFYIEQDPQSAIDELNYRFKDNGVGYEFVEGELIRIDRVFLHEETVKPAIRLLVEMEFQGAAEEFLKAHEHYRNRNYKDALVNTLKSFESVMKTICDKKGYTYKKGSDTAQKLIAIILENNLVPEYLSNHFASLRSTLETGLPTVRNKKGGHGQGAVPVEIEPYFVEYAINLAATNIVFLVNAYKDSKN